MPNRVSKVDEVAQPCFTFVYGHYVGFYGYGPVDDRKKEALRRGAGRKGTTCRAGGRGFNGGEYFR